MAEKNNGLKRMMELAAKIKDKDLRKKVVEVLNHPKLSHPEITSRPCDLKEAPASIQYHHVYKEGLIDHIIAVTEMCISVAEVLKNVYKADLDMDALIAASLVHDIGKLWGMKKSNEGWGPGDVSLDHLILGTCELYARGFPEKVLHIVASHFGENGPTPPATTEAVIFHKIDNMDATLGTVSQDNIIKMLLGQ